MAKGVVGGEGKEDCWKRITSAISIAPVIPLKTYECRWKTEAFHGHPAPYSCEIHNCCAVEMKGQWMGAVERERGQ